MATDEPVISGVAGRYASALFDLAVEANTVPEVEHDLAQFQELYEANPDLARMVRSPVIPAEEQARALTAILQRAGAGALVQQFFKLIAKNRRLFAAHEMARAFRALAAKSRGEVSAEVVSAHPLTEAQAQELKETLKAKAGKDVKLKARVDPTLLGGLIVKIGSRMIDSSLKTKLQSLRLSLKGGV